MKSELHYRRKRLASCALIAPFAVQAWSHAGNVDSEGYAEMHGREYAPDCGVLS